MKTLIEYWRSAALKINLGDYIVEVLLSKFDIDYECYSVVKNTGRLNVFNKCFLGVGTMLDVYWMDYINLPIDVWGCGYGGDIRFPASPQRNMCSIHAVRGPLTREALCLPADIPLGDPGLLLPHLFEIPRSNDSQIIYIPHFESRDVLPRNTLEVIGADAFVDICCHREEFFERITAIVNSKFVLTTSLHGAIIAQAYEIPWAVCCPPYARHNMHFKWEDWFAYLGIKFKFCKDFDEAQKWWSDYGSRGKVGDLEPLIEAFPIKNISNYF